MERLAELREQTRAGFYRRFRQPRPDADFDFRRRATEEKLSLTRAAEMVYRRMFAYETPVIVPGERIAYTRTVIPCATVAFDERDPELADRVGHQIENLSPDWGLLLAEGLAGRREAARRALAEHTAEANKREWLETVIGVIDAAEDLVNRYAVAARQAGEADLAERVARVPMGPATSFHDALQSLRFGIGLLRLGPVGHLGLGRFDQYMWPFLKRDLAAGLLTDTDARELLAEFFIALNRDADLYFGVQQGDNGQSLMLGGCDRDGRCAVNSLTRMVLDVSREVNLIDPKINLRVDANTPDDLLVAAARLTAKGLGFPQFCNDDVVIPGLVAFGYPLETARDYTVAACWEFVLPGGRDIPNALACNLALATDDAIREGLAAGETFDGILARVKPAMRRQIDSMIAWWIRPGQVFPPDPLFSALVPGCVERGADLNQSGGTHYNLGCHGAGSSSAVDALAAVRELVFERNEVTPERYLAALASDYRDDPALRERIRHCPKTGNDDEATNDLLRWVFDEFADALLTYRSVRGGRVRPGTGSAQAYVEMTQPEHAKPWFRLLGATADGRVAGDYISSSLSPAPGTRVRGLLSVFATYGQLDYRRLVNGGPITAELSDTYFADSDSLEKVAQLLHAFVRSGCQQLQLNTLNPGLLRDAQRHPDRHRDLVVRVWGWSGYFVELAPAYQNQIIGRQAFAG